MPLDERGERRAGAGGRPYVSTQHWWVVVSTSRVTLVFDHLTTRYHPWPLLPTVIIIPHPRH